MQISHYRDYAALREAMSHAEWSTAATFLHKREMCKTLQLDTIISYLKHHGKDKCAEYDVPFLSAPTALRGASRNVAQYEAYELAVAMGLDDAGAYPARETLSNAAQRAAEDRTVSEYASAVLVSLVDGWRGAEGRGGARKGAEGRGGARKRAQGRGGMPRGTRKQPRDSERSAI